MRFWEYEYVLDEIKNMVEEEEKRQKQQEKDNKAHMPNYNNMMSSIKSSMPKINAPKY